MNIVEDMDLKLEDTRYNVMVMGCDQRFLKTLLSDWGESSINIDYFERVKMISMYRYIDKDSITSNDISVYINKYIRYIRGNNKEKEPRDILFLYTVYKLGMSLGMKYLDNTSADHMFKYAGLGSNVITDSILDKVRDDVITTMDNNISYIGYYNGDKHMDVEVSTLTTDDGEFRFVTDQCASGIDPFELYDVHGEVCDKYDDIMTRLSESDDLLGEIEDLSIDTYTNGYLVSYDHLLSSTTLQSVTSYFDDTLYDLHDTDGVDLLLGLMVYAYGYKNTMITLLNMMTGLASDNVHLSKDGMLYDGHSDEVTSAIHEYISKNEIANGMLSNLREFYNDNFLKKDHNKYIGEW